MHQLSLLAGKRLLSAYSLLLRLQWVLVRHLGLALALLEPLRAQWR